MRHKLQIYVLMKTGASCHTSEEEGVTSAAPAFCAHFNRRPTRRMGNFCLVASFSASVAEQQMPEGHSGELWHSSNRSRSRFRRSSRKPDYFSAFIAICLVCVWGDYECEFMEDQVKYLSPKRKHLVETPSRISILPICMLSLRRVIKKIIDA